MCVPFERRPRSEAWGPLTPGPGVPSSSALSSSWLTCPLLQPLMADLSCLDATLMLLSTVWPGSFHVKQRYRSQPAFPETSVRKTRSHSHASMKAHTYTHSHTVLHTLKHTHTFTLSTLCPMHTNYLSPFLTHTSFSKPAHTDPLSRTHALSYGQTVPSTYALTRTSTRNEHTPKWVCAQTKSSL